MCVSTAEPMWRTSSLVSSTKNGIQNVVKRLRQSGCVHSGRHPGTSGREPVGTPLHINEYEKVERQNASHTYHELRVHINCCDDHGHAGDLVGISMSTPSGLKGWAAHTKHRQERATKSNLLWYIAYVRITRTTTVKIKSQMGSCDAEINPTLHYG